MSDSDNLENLLYVDGHWSLRLDVRPGGSSDIDIYEGNERRTHVSFSHAPQSRYAKFVRREPEYRRAFRTAKARLYELQGKPAHQSRANSVRDSELDKLRNYASNQLRVRLADDPTHLHPHITTGRRTPAPDPDFTAAMAELNEELGTSLEEKLPLCEIPPPSLEPTMPTPSSNWQTQLRELSGLPLWPTDTWATSSRSAESPPTPTRSTSRELASTSAAATQRSAQELALRRFMMNAQLSQTQSPTLFLSGLAAATGLMTHPRTTPFSNIFGGIPSQVQR